MDHDDLPEHLRTLLTALAKLPRADVVSFHGGRLPSVVGASEVFTLRGITATSLDLRVATEAGAFRELVAFRSYTGRWVSPFSRHPDEQEVAFLPGTSFRMMGSVSISVGSEACPCSVVEEVVDGQPALDPAVLHRDVERAASTTPLEAYAVTSPGKFTADLF